MDVKILQLLDGARVADGVTVIIDVFRAFSFEAYMFSMGVERIFPTASVEFAKGMKKRNPDYILAGERGGKIIDGFDIGNAPSDLHKLSLCGRCAVHTTSAGTQGIDNAKNADLILGASLVNARATAEFIRKSGADKVSLVCMGLAAKEPTDEDTLCARYIKSILCGGDIDMKKEIEALKLTSGAKFFDKNQSDVFPEADFYMCTDVDKFDFVMKYTRGECGVGFMRKEIVR